MRVGNWNLNHGGRTGAKWREQSELLQGELLDLVVLTEPPAGASLPGCDSVESLPTPEGWPWVAIVGPGVRAVDLGIPFNRMAVAAVATIEDRDVVVYGSVLPWRSIAKQTVGILHDGESYRESFARLLQAQSNDVATLQRRYPEALVLWAGDFNQSLDGEREYVGSMHQRGLLEEALTTLGMTAWNRSCAHESQKGMNAIDLVCGPASVKRFEVSEMSGSLDYRKLSDHAGYVVSFDP